MQEATYSGSEPERWREQVHLVFSQLDEKQRRLVAWFLSNALGRGGVTRLSRITGLDRKTVRRGRDQLDNGLKDCPTGPILSLGTVGLPTASASCGFATPVDKQPGPPASNQGHPRDLCISEFCGRRDHLP